MLKKQAISNKLMEKIVLGSFETVQINSRKIKAKIDSGADGSSICTSIIKSLELKPLGKKIKIKSSHGATKRELFLGEIIIKGKKLTIEFTAIDRSKLNAKILIGKDILKKGFLVDVSK